MQGGSISSHGRPRHPAVACRPYYSCGLIDEDEGRTPWDCAYSPIMWIEPVTYAASSDISARHPPPLPNRGPYRAALRRRHGHGDRTKRSVSTAGSATPSAVILPPRLGPLEIMIAAGGGLAGRECWSAENGLVVLASEVYPDSSTRGRYLGPHNSPVVYVYHAATEEKTDVPHAVAVSERGMHGPLHHRGAGAALRGGRANPLEAGSTARLALKPIEL